MIEMLEDIFNYYKNEYKVEWLPNGDIDIYNKSIKKEDSIAFAIYFRKKNKEYAITIDTEIIWLLKKEKIIFTNTTYWKQVNHIHLDDYNNEIFKENIIKIVDKYLK